MTISSTTRVAGPFIGNGTATVFPFTFKVFAAADLDVIRLNSSTGVESTLVLNSDYTVTLNGNQNTNPGGSVTLSAGALATGLTLTITSDIANLQPTDLTNQGGFYPEVITDSLDRATIQIQQISDIGDRTLKIPISDGTSINMELPTASQRANSFLAFDASGEPTVVTAGSSGSPATITRQVFSGTGSQTAFTLASDPGALGNSAQVYIGGVYQQRSTYTILGTTLTFSAAPVAGTDNIEFVNFLTDNVGSVSADLVTYTPAGAGAVARTAQAKLREWISPADFGAVGNSNASGTVGTDDTAALTALEVAHTGKVVNLDGKYYLVTSVPKANMYVNGSFVVPAATTDDQPANAAFGRSALTSNTFIPRQHSSSTLTWASGNFNTAYGADCMSSNTTGRRNTAIGSQAMRLNTTGFYNTVLGAWALYNNISGNYNTAIGVQALQLNTGSSNTAIGNGAMVGNTNGVDNVGIGDSALGSTTNRNVAIGKQAATTHTGNDCIAIGYQALSAPTSSGLYNVVIGNASGGSLTTGNSNTAVGRRSLSATSTGSGNVAIGNDAMVSAGNGSNNTAVGNSAASNLTTGYQNVVVGVSAGGALADGFNNSFVGRFAGQATTSGAGNVAVGEQSLSANTTGNYNTAVGTATAGGSNYDNTSMLGYQATVTGSNQVQLGNSSTTTYAYGAVQNRSDARDKADVRNTVLGLKFINALRPVDFKWDYREDYDCEQKDGSKKRSRYHHGLIAQEVKAVADAAGVDFGGFQDHSIKGGEDVMSIGYDELIGPLIKAVQELSDRIVALENK